MFFKSMKSILFIGLMCGVVFAGCEDETEAKNEAPFAPSDPNPEANASDVSTMTVLSWSCTDPDGDVLTYDVYFGTNSTPDAEDMVSAGQSETTLNLSDLEYNTTYFWRINAFDDLSNEIEGPVWSFTTRGPALGDQRMFELGESGETIEMIWIPAGTFWMGAQDDENDSQTDERPRHEVTISEGFWMGKYEVTQAQWEAVAGFQYFEWPGNPNYPAENVTYFEVTTCFLAALGDEWRLPTEAEWEYAARNGEDDEWFWWGSTYDNLDDYCWYVENSDGQTHEVGSKLPSPWGFYDMYGNVNEWCSDWYLREYYETSPDTDPQGPETGTLRVHRGGGWNFINACARSSNRYFLGQFERSNDMGFRLVRTAQ